MLVLGNSTKDGKETVEIGNSSKGGKESMLVGRSKGQAAVNILPPVGLHQARREATSPSLRGSFSRLASEARRRFSMRTLSLQQQRTSLSCNQPGAESLVLNGVGDPGVKYCDDIPPV